MSDTRAVVEIKRNEQSVDHSSSDVSCRLQLTYVARDYFESQDTQHIRGFPAGVEYECLHHLRGELATLNDSGSTR